MRCWVAVCIIPTRLRANVANTLIPTNANRVVNCDAVKDHAHCDHEHHCPQPTVESLPSVAIVHNASPCCSEFRCDHSDSCDEAHCAYVISSPVTIDFDTYSLVDFLEHASSRTRSATPSVCTNLRTCWPAQLGHSSSVHFCAALQSWQI